MLLFVFLKLLQHRLTFTPRLVGEVPGQIPFAFWESAFRDQLADRTGVFVDIEFPELQQFDFTWTGDLVLLRQMGLRKISCA